MSMKPGAGPLHKLGWKNENIQDYFKIPFLFILNRYKDKHRDGISNTFHFIIKLSKVTFSKNNLNREFHLSSFYHQHYECVVVFFWRWSCNAFLYLSHHQVLEVVEDSWEPQALSKVSVLDLLSLSLCPKHPQTCKQRNCIKSFTEQIGNLGKVQNGQ